MRMRKVNRLAEENERLRSDLASTEKANQRLVTERAVAIDKLNRIDQILHPTRVTVAGGGGGGSYTVSGTGGAGGAR